VMVLASRVSTGSPFNEIVIQQYAALGGHRPPLQVKWSRSAESLIPIFPNRLKTAMPEDGGNFGGRTFIADLELTGSEFVFFVLELRGDDAAADGAVQMLAALPG